MFWNAKGAGRDAHADVRRLQESVGRAGGIAYRSTANPRLPPEVSNYTHHVYYVPGAQAVPGVTYFVDMANPHEGAFPLRVAVSGEKYAGADGNRLNGLIRPLDTATLYEARGLTVPEDVRAKLVGVAYDRTMGGLAEKLTSLAFPAAVWTRDRTVLVKRDGESIAERMKNWDASQLQNAVRRMDMHMDLVDDLMDVMGSVFDAARAESEDDFDSIVATCVGASNAARILANAVLAQQGRPPLPAPVAEGVWFRSLKDACPFLDAARTSCRLDIVVPTDGTPERTPVDLDSLLRPAHNS